MLDLVRTRRHGIAIRFRNWKRSTAYEAETEREFDSRSKGLTRIVEDDRSHRETKGHFLSPSLPVCSRQRAALNCNILGGPPASGLWKWHADCPSDLLPVHRVYERFVLAGSPSVRSVAGRDKTLRSLRILCGLLLTL